MKPRLSCRRTMGGLIAAGLLLSFRPGAAIAESISLTWDRNPEPDLAGYEVCTGTSSRTYTQRTDVGNVTTFSVSGLSPGVTYYLAVRAYDIFGNKSGYSNEVSATTLPESEPASAITLSATGYKFKRWRKVRLRWNGSTAVKVDIYRNGSKIAVTANDGSYTDGFDKRRKGTYLYQVCVKGTSTCSNEATVTKFPPKPR